MLSEVKNEVASKHISTTITARCDKLSKLLCTELERSELRMHAVRVVVGHLITLGEADKACARFLLNRSLGIARDIKHLKMEGAMELYIAKLSRLFFVSLKEAAVEFGKLFTASERKSAYMDWAREEIDSFVSLFARQVLQSSTNSFANIAACVDVACEQCRMLLSVGLDLEFFLWESLCSGLTDAINEEGRTWIGAVSQAFAVETWEPHVFQGNHEQRKFVDTMTSLGVGHPEDYIDDYYTVICDVTLLFATTCDHFVVSACRLYNPKVLPLLVSWVVKLFVTFMNKLEKAYNGDQIFQINAVFVMDFVLPRAICAFRDRTGAVLPELDQLVNDVAAIWHTITKSRDDTL